MAADDDSIQAISLTNMNRIESRQNYWHKHRVQLFGPPCTLFYWRDELFWVNYSHWKQDLVTWHEPQSALQQRSGITELRFIFHSSLESLKFLY